MLNEEGRGAPDFLALPARHSKPRVAGITHVIDTGLPVEQMKRHLDAVGEFIDVWKFGYGLSYLDRQLPQKLSLLGAHDVKACPGGTLLEITWIQGRVHRYFDWLTQVGFDCVEISNGASPMPGETKHELVAEAVEAGFEVFAEVGSKDPNAIADPELWAAEAKADLAAGATWIVAEGRESGNVALYGPSGLVRSDLVSALEAVSADARIVYEAPQRAQQAWLIGHVGPNVSLANVATDGVLSLEALRLGLRADTLQCTPEMEDEQCST